MTFGDWPEELHLEDRQRKRMSSAAKASLTPLSIDRDNSIGVFSGRHGIYENVTLSYCPCGDFRAYGIPCKHIYRLAHELTGFDLGEKVVSDKSKVPVPDDWIRQENARKVSAVIDDQPPESYPALYAVLAEIKATKRPDTSTADAIAYLAELLK